MAPDSSVKTSEQTHCAIVGVIASRADLRMAVDLTRPPAFFELRLDCLAGAEDELERKIPKLAAPLIITARDPAEGGAHNLSVTRRRELLARFLAHAHYVDLELRSAEAFQSWLKLAAGKAPRRIISLHDFSSTPSPRSLHAKARAAKSAGADIFKVATRTDTPAQLARLFEFMAEHDAELPVSAMGMGKLGDIARVMLARCGSVLAYGSLAEPVVEGQLTVAQLQTAFRLFRIHK
jgi:3-dehydroquinate dehydratase type I